PLLPYTTLFRSAGDSTASADGPFLASRAPILFQPVIGLRRMLRAGGKPEPRRMDGRWAGWAVEAGEQRGDSRPFRPVADPGSGSGPLAIMAGFAPAPARNQRSASPCIRKTIRTPS